MISFFSHIFPVYVDFDPLVRVDGSTTLHQWFPVFFPYLFVDFAWHLARLPLKVQNNSHEKPHHTDHYTGITYYFCIRPSSQSRWLNHPPPMISCFFPIFCPVYVDLRDIWHVYHWKCRTIRTKSHITLITTQVLHTTSVFDPLARVDGPTTLHQWFPVFFPYFVPFTSISRDIWHVYHWKCRTIRTKSHITLITTQVLHTTSVFDPLARVDGSTTLHQWFPVFFPYFVPFTSISRDIWQPEKMGEFTSNKIEHGPKNPCTV